jgi:hypothetical protein
VRRHAEERERSCIGGREAHDNDGSSLHSACFTAGGVHRCTHVSILTQPKAVERRTFPWPGTRLWHRGRSWPKSWSAKNPAKGSKSTGGHPTTHPHTRYTHAPHRHRSGHRAGGTSTLKSRRHLHPLGQMPSTAPVQAGGRHAAGGRRQEGECLLLQGVYTCRIIAELNILACPISPHTCAAVKSAPALQTSSHEC